MITRLKGCLVIFENDLTRDQAKPLLDAIQMIRGVSKIEPEILDDKADYMARERIKQEYGQQLLDVLFPGKVY